MRTLALSGSIGMGKSTVTAQFSELGAATYSADEAVHRLLSLGGAAVSPVAAMFPEAAENGSINRKTLGKLVFREEKKLRSLEAILHPLVRQAEQEFLRQCEERGKGVAVLDIPLLYETGGEARFDAVAVVWAPAFIQRRRVLSRPGMTPEKFAAILARQLPNREKCARADYVIATGLGRAHSFRQVKAIMKELES